MNTITIIGNLGQDPVARFTTTGQKVTSFNVATRARKGGEDITSWFKITIWGDRFDKMMTHLKKGSYIVVVGELSKPEIYTDKTGKAQIQVEVTASALHFMPSSKGADGAKPAHTPSQSSFGEAQASGSDEELPF